MLVTLIAGVAMGLCAGFAYGWMFRGWFQEWKDLRRAKGGE